MNKLSKSRSKIKQKNSIPQFVLRANKKQQIDLQVKVNRIPKTKLKFGTNSNKQFINQDITIQVKSNQPLASINSFHKKSSSVTNRVSNKFFLLK